MYRTLVVLLSVWTCARATCGDGPPPPYSESRVMAHETLNQVLNLLRFPIASKEQRNFAIFAFTTDTVAQSIANGNNYEHAYSVVNIVIKLAELAPDAARKLVLKNVNKVSEGTQPIERLMDELCYPGSPIGTTGRRCDELVDSMVQLYPWYQPHATLLLDAGIFSQLFNENEADIKKAISESKVQEYLECNKHALEPFITQISKLLNLEKKLNGVVVERVS